MPAGMGLVVLTLLLFLFFSQLLVWGVPPTRRVFVDLPVATEGWKCHRHRGTFVVNLLDDGRLLSVLGERLDEGELEQRLTAYVEVMSARGLSSDLRLRAGPGL